MKKVNNEFSIDDLAIDVIEYAFTEWLVRRGVFAAFKANCRFSNLPLNGFRDQLRLHIRLSLGGSGLNLGTLISAAFPFVSTPEGVDFWMNQSDAWRRFCIKFQI